MSITPSNSFPSNSRTGPVPIDEAVRFDKDTLYYDMSGDKFLIILNHHTFEKKNPSTRHGTDKDERRLKEMFHKLGFKIFVWRDYKYQNIINSLTGIATRDHTKTSCIFVTILTHGGYGGQIDAADKPYPLREVTDMFDNKPSLTGKPKVFLIQACRGSRTDAGNIVYLGSQIDSVPTMPSSEMPSSEDVSSRQATATMRDMGAKLKAAVKELEAFKATCKQPIQEREDSEVEVENVNLENTFPKNDLSQLHVLHMDLAEQHRQLQHLVSTFQECSDMHELVLNQITEGEQKLCEAQKLLSLSDCIKDNDSTDRSDSQNVCVLTVPTHADKLVLHATVEDYVSYRNPMSGSWMIQAFCDTIEKHHEEMDLLSMIVLMNRSVAFENTPSDFKKQIPETTFTLTKMLKLEAIPR